VISIVGAALAMSGQSATPAGAAPIDDLCAQVNPTASMCIGLEKLADAAAAECRQLGLPDTDCTLPLSHHVIAAARDAYLASWAHRAVAFQYRLGNRLPLSRAQWLGTHNSFNSMDGGLTLSHLDSNQQLSLTDQLDIDIRALELDPHWLPRPNSAGGDVIVCHGRGADEQNLGCTSEPTLQSVLDEIAAWLNRRGHRDKVILLYLDNNFGPQAAYDKTIHELDTELARPDGKQLIYRPDPGSIGSSGCADLPLGVSRKDVRRTGARVIVVGGCESGWSADVFSWDDNHVESGSTPGYKPFPTCDATYPREVYDTNLVRYYEDSTFVSAAVDPNEAEADYEANSLSPAKVSAMTACGVNLLGMDQILAQDGRLEASVWSWARGQPRRRHGDCTVQRGRDGRWAARRCTTHHLVGCRADDGGWSVSASPVRYGRSFAACKEQGEHFTLPRTGYENATLHQLAASQTVWLHRRRH
jgi:hypothetical protein